MRSEQKTVELLVQEQMGMMSAYHNTIHWVNIIDPNNPYIDRYRKLPQEVREHMQKYALKGKFPVREDIIDKVLEKIDLVLIMSVFPGFVGQKFMPEVIEKIKSLK